MMKSIHLMQPHFADSDVVWNALTSVSLLLGLFFLSSLVNYNIWRFLTMFLSKNGFNGTWTIVNLLLKPVLILVRRVRFFSMLFHMAGDLVTSQAIKDRSRFPKHLVLSKWHNQVIWKRKRNCISRSQIS